MATSVLQGPATREVPTPSSSSQVTSLVVCSPSGAQAGPLDAHNSLIEKGPKKDGGWIVGLRLFFRHPLCARKPRYPVFNAQAEHTQHLVRSLEGNQT